VQQKSFQLQYIRVGCLPIIDRFLDRMGLHQELLLVLRNKSYADAVMTVLKNILIDREALYAIEDWVDRHKPALGEDLSPINDDRIGRSLDRLYEADRATLQTKIVLRTTKSFDLKMDRIHSDTTSVSVTGEYRDQAENAVQLKRGHSKDHRPDLKQLIYNLCVTSDGAVPVHFKVYDGNRSDDSIQFATWQSLRALLQRPNFIYVGDSKLCVEETMRSIDKEHGLFVTMVPRTRIETKDFARDLQSGDVRWEKILRKRSSRQGNEFDTFECAVGEYRLREGFKLYWYRSSQKQKRDSKSRKDRILRAIDRLENLNLKRMRGPKTEAAVRKRINAILSRFQVEDWLAVDVKFDEESTYKATTKGKPTKDTRYRMESKQTPRLHIRRQEEAIARSKLTDGIFPLATNTKETALEVLKIYKYQPRLEKRHALLKSTLDVAPVWLKRNSRIEALMFIEYLAQMTAALIERELRAEMVKQKVEVLASLPEGRITKTPTFEQVHRLFNNSIRHELYDKGKLVQAFSEPLSKVQSQVLSLLGVAAEPYIGG
jgi:transposase